MSLGPFHHFGLLPASAPGTGRQWLHGDHRGAVPSTDTAEGFALGNALMLHALDVISFPIVSVSEDGHILFANAAGLASLNEERWIREHNGRIAVGKQLRDPDLFVSEFNYLRSGRLSSLLVRDRATAHEAILFFLPVQAPRPPADQIRAGLLWLIPMAGELLGIREYARAYNLTRAEQGLLQRLLAGDELRTGARTLHISIHTARNHLKAILHKTGCRRQSQLLAMATRISALHIPPKYEGQVSARPAVGPPR